MLLERSATTVEEMETLGSQLGPGLHPGLVLFFHGELGAGKTTFIRGILRGLGYTGAVKSPTFTLVEPYSFAALTANHFDLYRLKSPEELEFLGIRDYLEGSNLCLIEWAERGAGALPVQDVDIHIERQEARRLVRLTACTESGSLLLHKLPTAMDVASTNDHHGGRKC